MNLETGRRAEGSSPDRLESWKAIAAYLNRGITTVQRWERDEGLPVHRLRHDTLGSVYAYTHELEAWRAKRAQRPAPERVAAGSPHLKAVAVLPFENLSSDREQEYLADAMTDVLTTALAQASSLRVPSRTSAMQYKSIARPVKEIARELKVDALVEGSVVRVGERLRITVQLIEAASDRHLWAQSYEGDLRDILTLQRDVAHAIAAEIGVSIANPMGVKPRRVRPEAYEAYVRGMFHLRKFTAAGYERAVACFRQALETDSDDSLAWAALAFAHGMISHSDLPAQQPSDAFREVRAAATRAVELDDSLAEAHVALAELKLYYDWDWAAAEHAFERALRLNPTLAEAHRHYGWFMTLRDRIDDALSALNRARDAEPLTPLYGAELGWAYWQVGRYADARREAERALELDPEFPVAWFVVGAVLRDEERVDEAVAAHRRAARVSKGWRWALGETYARTGQVDLAREIVSDCKHSDPTDAWDAFTLAYVAAALGDRDDAIRGLELMYHYRHGWTPWACKGVQAFSSLRDDSRFREIAERLRLPGG
jgi:TolB-like protein/Tfp pilus assembly protein PilF